MLKRKQISVQAEINEGANALRTSKQPSDEAMQKYGFGFQGDVDLRTKYARRMLVAYANAASDKGGEDYMTWNEREAARRAAFISAVCSDIEENAARNNYVSEDELNRYLSAVKTQTALWNKLGMRREPRNISGEVQTLDEYLTLDDETS